MATDLSIFCQVRCHSHILCSEAFQLIAAPECNLDIYDITDSTFFLGVKSKGLPIRTPLGFAAYGSYTLSCFLMALNIATLGHFEWAAKSQSVAAYSIFDHEQKAASGVNSKFRYKFPVETKRTLTVKDVDHACLEAIPKPT